MTVPRSITDELAPQLLEEIACNGPMQLDAFMQASAVHYYGAGNRIGASGDFTTAPEISQLFGEMIAAFLTYLASIAEAYDKAFLFEAGPGRGTLISDMKRSFAAINSQLNHADIILLEKSPVFRTLISERTATPVSFIGEIDALPHRPLFGVANEFFDALGTRQLIFDGTDWCWHLIDKVAKPQKTATPYRLPICADEINLSTALNKALSPSGSESLRSCSARSIIPISLRNTPCSTGPIRRAPAFCATRSRAEKSTTCVIS